MLRRAVLAAVLAAIAARPSPAGDGRYEIKLTRPVEAGQLLEYRGEASIETETIAIIGGREQQAASMLLVVSFDSVAQVLKVDSYGRPTAIAHEVRACELMHNGQRRPILTPGTTMIARNRGGKTGFFVKKHTFTDVELQALETVAGLDVYGATDDELFGTEQRRNVGEEWPINVDGVADEFRRMTKGKMLARGIRGKSQLVEIRESDGQPCQLIRTEVTLHDTLPGFAEMRPTARLEQSMVTVEAYDLLPVDTGLPGVADQATLILHAVVADDASDDKARISAKIKSQRTYKAMPMTAGAGDE